MADSEATPEKPAPMVEWVQPAIPSPIPKTEEEKEFGRNFGRVTPEPELLQPRLDKTLVDFKPAYDDTFSGKFTGTASDVLPSLVISWIESFQAYYPQVELNLATPYAGSLGILDLIEGTLDFVFVSRELKPTDVVSFTEKYGYPPYNLPIMGGSYRHYGFLDAMAFFVHPENPIDRITYKQIDSAFSKTRHRGGDAITTWGDLGLEGDWADKSVNLYGIKPWNGFETFVRMRILDVGDQQGEWRDDINFDKQVFPTAKKISADRYSLGYTGLAFVDAAVKALPLAQEDDGPYLAPSYENVAAATYPLSRLVYFNTNKKPDEPLNPVMQELLRFILSRQGQQLVIDHGVFIPLRGHQAASSMEHVD